MFSRAPAAAVLSTEYLWSPASISQGALPADEPRKCSSSVFVQRQNPVTELSVRKVLFQQPASCSVHGEQSFPFHVSFAELSDYTLVLLRACCDLQVVPALCCLVSNQNVTAACGPRPQQGLCPALSPSHAIKMSGSSVAFSCELHLGKVGACQWQEMRVICCRWIHPASEMAERVL